MTRDQMIATLTLLGWEPYMTDALVRMQGNLIVRPSHPVRECFISLTPQVIAVPDPEGNPPCWELIAQLPAIYNRVMEWTEME